MEENTNKAIKEIIIVRDGLTLKAPGFEVFGSFDSHYIFLTIHLSQGNGENIQIDKRVAKEIKDCLITRRASTIREESQSDETISYTHYNFIFDDDRVQLIVLKGKKYPMIESLQPKPTKTEFYINNAERIAAVAIIEQFLILGEKYRANESKIRTKITKYLEEQKKEEDKFISELAKELNIDTTDVSLIFKENKQSFPLFFGIMHNSE